MGWQTRDAALINPFAWGKMAGGPFLTSGPVYMHTHGGCRPQEYIFLQPANTEHDELTGPRLKKRPELSAL